MARSQRDAKMRRANTWAKMRLKIVGLKMQLEERGIKVNIPLKAMGNWGHAKMSEYYSTMLNKYSKELQ